MSEANGRPRLTWIGHATVLIEVAGARVLTDPTLRRRIGPLRRVVAEPDPALYGHLDAVLISHLHLDHLHGPSLRLLDRGVHLVLPKGGARTVRRFGFERVTEVRVGDRVAVGDIEVVTVPAQHSGARHPFNKADCVGYVLDGGCAIYFPGDTGLFDDMATLWNGLDLALLPIAGWGPRLPADDHLSPLLAARSLQLLRPRVAIPIHWGTFQLPGATLMRPPEAAYPAEAFVRYAAKLAPDVDAFVVPPGESVELGACEGD